MLNAGHVTRESASDVDDELSSDRVSNKGRVIPKMDDLQDAHSERGLPSTSGFRRWAIAGE